MGNVNAVITDRKVVSSGYTTATFSNSFDTWSQCTQAIRTTGAQAMRVDFYGPSNCVFKAITTVTGQNYLVRVKSSKGNTAGLRIKAFGSSLISSVNLAEDDFTTYSFIANSTSTTLIIEPTTASGSYYFVDEVNVATNSIYEATVVMKSDYYPFGMQMPGRNSNTGNYRFGYNGMEKDPEMKGEGNSYTTEFRQYDPRLGRWASLDPLAAKYPSFSPYSAFNNNPIYFVDPLGLEGTPTECDNGVQVNVNTQDNISYDSGNKMPTVAEEKFYNVVERVCSANTNYVQIGKPVDVTGLLITLRDRATDFPDDYDDYDQVPYVDGSVLCVFAGSLDDACVIAQNCFPDQEISTEATVINTHGVGVMEPDPNFPGELRSTGQMCMNGRFGYDISGYDIDAYLMGRNLIDSKVLEIQAYINLMNSTSTTFVQLSCCIAKKKTYQMPFKI